LPNGSSPSQTICVRGVTLIYRAEVAAIAKGCVRRLSRAITDSTKSIMVRECYLNPGPVSHGKPEQGQNVSRVGGDQHSKIWRCGVGNPPGKQAKSGHTALRCLRYHTGKPSHDTWPNQTTRLLCRVYIGLNFAALFPKLEWPGE
jgi:hypothetical protein